MSLIGLDFGTKKIGISAEVEGIAFPKGIVKREDIFSFLKKYFGENEISGIVVGLPYDLYGTDEKTLNNAKKFIEKLKNIFPDKEIFTIDERFSSTFDFSHKKGDNIDDISATMILSDFLNKIKNKK